MPKPKIGDTKPDYKGLLDKFPPKYKGKHHPKAKPTVEHNTVLDRLPNQGIVDWKKQETIKIGKPTDGIWAEPNRRGQTLAATAKAKQKKRLRK